MAWKARSKSGCWTCKLRKKKCDERRPICAACGDLDITCHGYGPKPGWMDGGAAEKAMMKTVQTKVKDSQSRKRKTMSTRIQSDGPESEVASSTPLTKCTEWRPTPSYPTPQSSGGDERPQSHAQIQSREWPRQNEDEASLVMFYLDFVFPLQYPFYKPPATEGGRGWLLSLLTQVKPLYHTILSVATYYQHYHAYWGATRGEVDITVCPGLAEQFKQYGYAIESLRQYLETREGGIMSLTDQVELLACMVMLISLEAFQCLRGSWETHLRTAAALLPQIQAAYDTDYTQLSVTHTTAVHFFSRAVDWYTILSDITLSPELYIPNPCRFYKDAYLPLHNIMGCEGWVMQSIMNINALEKWKHRMRKDAHLSMRELVGKVNKIEELLQLGLTRIGGATEYTTENRSLYSIDSKAVKEEISRIFAYAALVYLHVIESGPYPELPEIQCNVIAGLRALQSLTNMDLLLNLNWPLCILGCMAVTEQQEAFRTLVSSIGATRFVFGSSGQVLRILEENWRLRREKPLQAVDWKTAMDSLDVRLLMI